VDDLSIGLEFDYINIVSACLRFDFLALMIIYFLKDSDLQWTCLYIFWFMMVVGLLNNPFVTLLYLMEQCNIFIFGGSARASDVRILVWFLLNAAAICTGIYFY